ncbi:MAG TPA: penicillin-binding protein 1A [Novimethylophilus sp.]|jgi:penicillin-binding protein 1A|uniref:penicillin-binding protein 1A n=1 Tax=Novimethylophilus sp. TaxID=2137426 RepID=UPI002F42DB47
MFLNKWWQYLILATVVAVLAVASLIGLAAVLIYPDLPSLESLTDYRPKVPLRVYSEDGYLIGEFGEERRAVVKIEDVPLHMKQAILAAEDERFYQHGGVDTLGVLRAAFANLSAGGAKEGASTITMQVARNFFLSSEKTLKRKISEALLAIKIEHSLSKDRILELYINQIYLGQRAYGFAAASQVYYGKPLDKLNAAEFAMLAGLPKAPSRYNPFANLKRAEARQNYVLKRMRELKFLSESEYQASLKQELHFKASRQSRDLAADYVAEIVRQELYSRYQESIYSSGMKVVTTILKKNQLAANEAVLRGVLDYDKRHNYRGPEGLVHLAHGDQGSLEALMDDALDDVQEFGGLVPAVVLDASPKRIKAYRQNGHIEEITGDGLQLVARTLAEKAADKQKIKRGSIIRLYQANDGKWSVVQLPQVEAALVAADPQSGAIRALVGGFDFTRNKFNHATQAWRQPGSSFKPFIYSAALEKGLTAATVINDAPIVISAAETGSSEWTPQNFDGKFEGPMRMRTALTKSKNMVSIRILQNIGVPYAQDYIQRFGFSAKDHPPYLAMALGAGSVTPWQMVGAYSVFANGGYRVQPYLIAKITDAQGKLIEQAKPVSAGAGAEHVVDPRNTFIMTSILRDVARIGTAAKARELGRYDLAGKTGTTNNLVDAWFAGYNPTQVAVAWIGFDQPRTLGNQETGGHAALPMWISYMGKVLQGVPDEPYPVPPGVVQAKVNPLTGLRVDENESGLYEYFYQEFLPPLAHSGESNILDGEEPAIPPPGGGGGGVSPMLQDQLF